MARNFSDVGTSTPPSTKGAARPPHDSPNKGGRISALSPWQRRAAVAFVVLLVLAVGGAIIKAVTGSGDDATTVAEGPDTAAVGAPHGPSGIVDGVPVGYTRDDAGARTAAVNFTQAVGNSYQARISGTALRDTAVAAQPSAALTEVVDSASNRQDDSRVTNAIPLTATTTRLTDTEAVVSVWANSVSQTAIGTTDQVGIISLYGTTTVTLVWEDGDWKASDWSYQNGPNPDEARFPTADSPLAQKSVGSLYTFYVE